MGLFVLWFGFNLLIDLPDLQSLAEGFSAILLAAAIAEYVIAVDHRRSYWDASKR